MEAILGAGATVDAAFDDGSTALHFAALDGGLTAIEKLVKGRGR